MLHLIKERQPGYNIFLGVGSSVPQCLFRLHEMVKAVEDRFTVDIKSMTLKYGEDDARDNVYAIQVCDLVVRQPKTGKRV